MRQRIDTTYADLRPTDLVIDKSGQAWPIADVKVARNDHTEFWLCDPVTKVRMHSMFKNDEDAVKVSRLPTQADEAAKLEADFPKSGSPASGTAATTSSVETGATGLTETDSITLTVGVAEAVAAVEAVGGTVEAEVTAAEVDAAAAATDDAPVSLPPFADMTPLEQRSHLYLLHGVMAHDVQSRDTLSTWHQELHSAENTVKSHYVPHVHAPSTDAKSRG